jgi:hypothetical protein
MTYRRATILVIVLPLFRLKLTLFITVCACVVAGLPPKRRILLPLFSRTCPRFHNLDMEHSISFVYIVILPSR